MGLAPEKYDGGMERRGTAEDYWSLPEDARAELIDGVFYDMAPPMRIHQALTTGLLVAIHTHIQEKGGDCRVYPAPFGVQFSEARDTVVEPDLSVICDPKKLTDRGCLGAPDWIVEIVSPSSIAHDYLRKLELYSGAGVREYWIVNPMERNVIAYTDLDQDKPYVMTYRFEDTIPVGICPGFQIDMAAIAARL